MMRATSQPTTFRDLVEMDREADRRARLAVRLRIVQGAWHIAHGHVGRSFCECDDPMCLATAKAILEPKESKA